MTISHTLGRLRLTGIFEGLSFVILLFVAMPLKYVAGQPEMVRIVGTAHGVFFILYILLSFIAKLKYPWTWKTMLLLWAASIIPFGTFYADYKMLRFQRP